jgi:PncC family amidohydrolase
MGKPIITDVCELLLKNKITIATAESCSGGLLAKMLTDTPGSSSYFLLGAITYSNSAKNKILNIPLKTINKYGAVSKTVAQLMADSIRKIANSSIGIGITGIAGPSGASKNKPKGMVFIALASRNKTICKKFYFPGNRNSVRTKAAQSALKLIKNQIK